MRQCIFYTDAPLCTSAGLHLSLPWGYTHRWTGTMGLAEAKKIEYENYSATVAVSFGF